MNDASMSAVKIIVGFNLGLTCASVVYYSTNDRISMLYQYLGVLVISLFTLGVIAILILVSCKRNRLVFE